MRLSSTWQKWDKLVEELKALVTTFSLWSSALGQQPRDHVAQAQRPVWRETSVSRKQTPSAKYF